MKTLNRADILDLAKPQSGTCVSIYLTLDHRVAQQLAAAIALKDSLRFAEARLAERGVGASTARDMLASAYGLVDKKLTGVVGAHGLAVFIDERGTHEHPLPFSVPTVVWVGKHFYVKPLVPLLSPAGGYFVLAVSQKHVRLLRGTATTLTEVAVPDLPANLGETLHLDQPDGTFQFHTARLGTDVKKDGAYHGQGGAADRSKEDLVRYFREIDRALRPVLAGKTEPLVFAGVDYLFPLYKQANHYTHLLDEHVGGNPDQLPAGELCARAWSLVEPLFQQPQRDATARVSRSLGDNNVSDDVKEILRAAEQGRVDTLLIAQDKALWGTFDPDSGAIHFHAEQTAVSEDLIDRACAATLNHRGNVYAVSHEDMPGGEMITAQLRFGATAATGR